MRALVLLLAVLGSGCLIDRSPIAGEPSRADAGLDATLAPLDASNLDAPGLDAPGLDAPGLDAGEGCVPIDCDDGNACTDDACTPSGCAHTPHTRACDDGIRCNGGDRCDSGSCSVHDGIDPCAAPTRCDATSDSCVGCRGDTDCPARELGPLGACMPASPDVCAAMGSASRSVTTYACVAGTCSASTSSETAACRRETDGVTCAPEVVTDFGPCSYVDATCSESGSRSRSRTTSACALGVCSPVVEIEIDTMGCGRSTSGTSCGPETRGDWGPCGGFTDACDESGTRSRQVFVPTCSSGACTPEVRTETEACTRVTAGVACGAESCGAFDACQRLDATNCATAGTQSRACATPICSGGTCSASTARMESQSCAVAVMGLACAPAAGCTPCLEPGMARCRDGRDGERFCSDGIGVCGMFTCVDTTPVRETCACP
jgi:hypothetical protein